MKKFELVLVALLFYAAAFAHEGKASYYHDKFEGRRTASGTIFTQNKMTCAHKTLPFGTKLLVTNLSNDKQIQVVVTDRGPFIKGRHIDLSKSAASKIGMIGKGVQKINFKIVGVVPVKVKAYNKPRSKSRDSTNYILKPDKEYLTVSYNWQFKSLHILRSDILNL